MVSAGAAIVSVKAAVAVWADEAESVTLNVSGVEVIGVAGVPLISPVVAVSDSPAGSVPTVNSQL